MLLLMIKRYHCLQFGAPQAREEGKSALLETKKLLKVKSHLLEPPTSTTTAANESAATFLPREDRSAAVQTATYHNRQPTFLQSNKPEKPSPLPKSSSIDDHSPDQESDDIDKIWHKSSNNWRSPTKQATGAAAQAKGIQAVKARSRMRLPA